MFGFDEGFAKRAEKIANYVEAVRKQLRRRIDVLSGAVSLQRKGEMTREMGVKIDRPEDAVRIIERLARLDAAYEAMDPELGIVEAAESWDGKSEVKIDWRRGELSGNSEQVGDGSFSVSARFLGTAQEAKDALRSVQGRVFRNEATGIEAMVTSDTVGKSYAAQMSVRNLMALGYSQEEARQIHYSAFAHVHEIFERADYGEFEKNYAPEQKKGRAGAWHYYGTVDIEGKGSFDVNVTAVVPDRNGGDNRLFSLELTIENPADGRLGYPHTMGPSFNAAGSSEHRLAAYRSNVEKEILKIREEAMKDGTYMKAPNGEDSKLDERTWCVVRTRAFKDYFGDWENDPEGASKVVDSNGEPMLVYHGTPEDFGNVFEDKQPKDRDFDPNYHRGTFWFTDRRFTAQTYQGKAVFTRHPEPLRRLDTEWEHEDVPAGEHADVLEGLKERTVFRAYDTRHSMHGVRVKLSEAFDEDGMLKEDYYVALELKKGEERVLPSGKRPLSRQLFRASRGSNYFLQEGVKPPRTHKEALEFYARFEGVGDRISVPVRSRLYACFLNIRNPKVYDYKGEKFRDMGYRAAEAQAEGHDGVIVKNVYDPGNYPDAVLPGMSIGVFSPGQIKSVDNRGTFDAGSGDISMSVRNLAAVHTLSVENFLKQAKEWGGMPLPSVAVTRLDRPYDWDVDHEPMVMLVGRPDMVDPEGGAEVYARDAWMGRMPEVEEERGEDGKVRRFFYDEKGEKVDATLENMTGYLMRRKQKGNSAHETPDAARSLMARRLRSMEDVKGRRRMLQAEPENRVTDVEIYRWMDMATEHDWGWSAKKARTLFRVLADVDEVTKWNVLAAIEGSEEEDLMELQNGLDEDSDFIRETVRVMKEMRKERRNYVEATPRRVVGMDEWVYAVFSEKIPDKDEVRRVCRENGIIPIEYKAGERDKAMGQLIDDGDVSFSVRGASLLDRVNLREMAEEEKMSRLMTRARRSAARWRRVFMDDKTSAADAARALGEVSSVMEAVYMYLPAGERPVYAGKMKLVEAYARLVETGRVWHRENAKSEEARAKQEVLDEVMGELEKVSTVKGEALREVREGYVREVAGRKLSEVAVSMVEDAVDAVERHLVRREMDLVKRLAEALKPRKLKSGKLAPGKMSAEGYRRFARYMKMVEMSAEEKAERMEELAGKNYFRAFFDVGQETTQRTLGERAEGKASGGGKIYITYTRHQHHSKVDPTMNLLTAYLTVQKQQDVLLAYRDLPQKIQGVLAHQEDGVRMSAALERGSPRKSCNALEIFLSMLRHVEQLRSSSEFHFYVRRVSLFVGGASQIRQGFSIQSRESCQPLA